MTVHATVLTFRPDKWGPDSNVTEASNQNTTCGIDDAKGKKKKEKYNFRVLCHFP